MDQQPLRQPAAIGLPRKSLRLSQGLGAGVATDPLATRMFLKKRNLGFCGAMALRRSADAESTTHVEKGAPFPTFRMVSFPYSFRASRSRRFVHSLGRRRCAQCGLRRYARCPVTLHVGSSFTFAGGWFSLARMPPGPGCYGACSQAAASVLRT